MEIGKHIPGIETIFVRLLHICC